MSAIPTNLDQILIKSRENHAQGLRTMAIFDLDSTLFNVSTRTQKILQEFAETHKIEKLKDVIVYPSDWGIKEALFRAGYSLEKDQDLLIRIRDFWSQRFFSSDYLHYDVPYKGAVSFVQELKQSCADICYLTGRDELNMRKGSLEVLNKWGFPLEQESHLHMKVDKQVEDELFKYNWFKSFEFSSFNNVYFFENEPININAVKSEFSNVHVIYLDTTHARKQEVQVPVLKISDFMRN